MEQLTQPFISIDIHSQAIEALCQSIAKALASKGIKVERSENDLHVSLAYVLGSCERSLLTEVVERIAEHKLEAKVVGLEILEGQTTDYDYVALSFEAGNEFAAVSKEISKKLSTRTFRGGFCSHLTLFRLKKGEVKIESVQSICKSLRFASEFKQTKVCAKAVSVFNSSFEKQFSIAV